MLKSSDGQVVGRLLQRRSGCALILLRRWLTWSERCLRRWANLCRILEVFHHITRRLPSAIRSTLPTRHDWWCWISSRTCWTGKQDMLFLIVRVLVSGSMLLIASHVVLDCCSPVAPCHEAHRNMR